jgi:hypothetical protein
MLGSLKSAFPDARIVICVRPPQETAPSQISSMRGAWSFFGNPADTPEYGERWLKLLEHYYRLLSEFIESHPGPSVQCVEMHSLKNGLERTVRRLYAEFGLCPGNGFAARLAEEDRVSRSYRSRHVYSLSEYGLDSDTLAARFDGAWTALSAHAASHARRGETETSAT